MNAAQLLAHFDRLAEAPDAVPRLRRFILDLAVRGKLVEQDAGDESALNLLKRIHKERAQLLKKGTTRKTLDAVETAEDSRMFDIPSSWAWTSLAEIADFSAGRTPSRHDAVFWNTGDYPWISIRDMKAGETLVNTSETISEFAKLKVFGSEPVPAGTMIMSFKLTIGRISRLGIPSFHNEAIISIRPHLLSLDPYLFKVLPLFAQSGNSKDAIKGATLNRESLSNIPIALPPLAEQHRIVAKVDELMALCDQLEAAQQERERRRDRLAAASLQRLNQPADATPATDQTESAEARQQAQREQQKDHARFHLQNLNRLTTRPEHIKAMRQTILNLAVRGCLLPQDTNNEPAIDLIERIRAEKLRLIKVGTLKKANLVAQIPDEEIQFALPSGWLWVRLGDLLLGDSQNGYSKRPDDAVDGVPILRINAGTVRQDGIVAEEQYKLIGGITPAHRRQYEVRPGDLLACRFNGNRHFVGRISLYTGYLGNSPIYPDKLIRLRLLHEFVLPKLVRHFAESEPVRKDIEGYCATTVGNWGISASNMKDVKIPLPPLAEQHRIVAKVDELMALCDQLEAQLTQSQTDSRRLLEAVLDATLAPA